MRRAPPEEGNPIISSGVARSEAVSTRRRPKRSLIEPPVSAPTAPAACSTVSDAPASHRLSPDSLSIRGR